MIFSKRLLVFIILALLVFVFRKTKFIESWLFKISRLTNIHRSSEFEKQKEGLKEYVLGNDLKVSLINDKNAPKVAVCLGFKVGSANESQDKKGIAHLLEHMFFKGTKKLSEVDVHQIAKFYRAEYNAFTGKDFTYYYFQVDKENYRPFLEIFADCAVNLTFGQDQLNSELQAVINEMKMRMDNARLLGLEKIFQHIFGENHKYAHSPIGAIDDLINANSKDVYEFYKKHYRMDNARLLVVGNFDKPEVEATIQELFGSIIDPEKVQESHSESKVEGKMPRSQEVVFNVNCVQPEVVVTWVMPGMSGFKNALKADILTQLLFCTDGVLVNNLKVKHKDLFNSLEISILPHTDHLVFSIIAKCDEQNIQKCTDLIKSEFEILVKDGFKQQEFLRAKILVESTLETITPAKTQLNSAIPFVQSFVQASLMSGISAGQYLDAKDVLAGIYSSDLDTFIQCHFRPEQAYVATLMPLDQKSKAVFEAENEEFEKVSKALLKTRVRKSPIEGPRVAKELVSMAVDIEVVFPKAKFFKLTNGVRVVAVNKPESPTVVASISTMDYNWLKDSVEGSVVYSIANTLLLDNQNKKTNHQGFINLNAPCQFSHLGINLTANKAYFTKAFEHLVGLIKNRSVTEQDVQAFSKSGVNNLSAGLLNHGSLADRTRAAVLYKDCPDFGWTHQQAIELCGRLSVEQIQAAWSNFFDPERMVVVLAGAIPDGLDSMLERQLKFLTSPNGEQKRTFELPEMTFGQRQDKKIACSSNQNAVLFVRPNNLAAKDKKRFALSMLNSVFTSGQMGSELFKIREAKGLFYGASGSLAFGFNTKNSFDFISFLIESKHSNELDKELNKMFAKIRRDGVDQLTLISAKNNLLKDLKIIFGNEASLVNALLSLSVNELDPEFYDSVVDYVKNLSLDEFNVIAKECCDFSNWSRIEVGKLS